MKSDQATGAELEQVSAATGAPIGEWIYVIGVVGFAWLMALAWICMMFHGLLFIPALIGLMFVGGVIPATLQELGWHFYCKRGLFNVGTACQKLAFSLGHCWWWQRNGTRSIAALRMAQASLLHNDIPQALKWSDLAVKTSRSDGWFAEFYALSVLGQIRYAIGDQQNARDCCTKAMELFKGNVARDKDGVARFKLMRQGLERFQITNLDLLGRLALHEGDVAAAEARFDESYRLRMTIPDRVPLAKAFREYSMGLTAFERFDVATARTHFANAVEAIPDLTEADLEEGALAVEICSEASGHAGNEEDFLWTICTKLGSIQQRKLPRRLISMAAGPMPLLHSQPQAELA